MAQVKVLKIVAGLPSEHDGTSDDITFLSGNFGNVQVSANAIISTDTDGDLSATPDGTGDLILDGVKWPQADGSANQILSTDGAGQLSYVAAFAENVDRSYTTDGSGVTIRDGVTITANDVVTTSDASAESSSRLIGFATATIGAASAVTIRKNGTLGGFSGFTAGDRMFLSETAGEVTSTAPTTAASNIVQAGFALNATTLDLQIQFLGRRL